MLDYTRCSLFFYFLGPEVKTRRLQVRNQVNNHEIVAKIETETFYDGYHLALGFAVGPFKSAFCPNDECRALVSGQACRHALRARTSIEAAGMDAFTMAVKVG